MRSHIYGSAVADFPRNDAVTPHAEALTAIRADLPDYCERHYEQATKLATDAAALGLKPLKDAVRDAKIGKGEALQRSRNQHCSLEK